MPHAMMATRARRVSLPLGAGELDDLGLFFGFRGQQSAKVGRRTRNGHAAAVRKRDLNRGFRETRNEPQRARKTNERGKVTPTGACGQLFGRKKQALAHINTHVSVRRESARPRIARHGVPVHHSCFENQRDTGTA